MGNLDTLFGALMLFSSLVFLAYGIRSGVRDKNIITGRNHAGVYVLVGFAFLAMGILVFLIGLFR